MAQPIRGKVGHLVFPIDPKNTNLVEYVHLGSCFLSSFVEFLQLLLSLSPKILYHVFPINLKNTNFVEEFEILLQVNFR